MDRQTAKYRAENEKDTALQEIKIIQARSVINNFILEI